MTPDELSKSSNRSFARPVALAEMMIAATVMQCAQAEPVTMRRKS